MSEGGKAEDACASRATPRLEERVCERGRRPTLDRNVVSKLQRGHNEGRSRSSLYNARPFCIHPY